jgi:hypothetical protein
MRDYSNQVRFEAEEEQEQLVDIICEICGDGDRGAPELIGGICNDCTPYTGELRTYIMDGSPYEADC